MYSEVIKQLELSVLDKLESIFSSFHSLFHQKIHEALAYLYTRSAEILRTMSKYGRIMCNLAVRYYDTERGFICARMLNRTQRKSKYAYAGAFVKDCVVNSLAITTGTSYTHRNILAYVRIYVCMYLCTSV